MPSKKSAESLEKLCLECVHNNLNALQVKAKYLTLDLINDLYEKSVLDYKSSDSPAPLNADLFLHARTITIHSLSCFDRPVDEIVDKINQNCKNLRNIHLTFMKDVDCIHTITMNIPSIVRIDLQCSGCTDSQLYIIGKHCPRLKQLYLFDCPSITDAGLNFLPQEIEELGLPDQITLTGQLNILEHLTHLKALRYFREWNNVIEALANRVDKHMYQIEEMEIYNIMSTTCNISDTVSNLFPKVRNIRFGHNFTLGSQIASFLEGLNCNLLTHLHLCASESFISIVGHLCPSLEVLIIRFNSPIQISSDRWSKESNNIPFKNVRDLEIWDESSNLSRDCVKSLLANCWRLERFIIRYFNMLSDEVINDLLKTNPFKCLGALIIDTCQPFTVESVCVLLKSLDSLLFFCVSSCRHFMPADKDIVEKLVEGMNWQLELDLSYNG